MIRWNVLAMIGTGAVLGHMPARGQDTAALDKLRSCSSMSSSEQTSCLKAVLNELNEPAASPAARPVKLTAWMVSQTASPLDYSPIAIVSASTVASNGKKVRFSIECRSQRANLIGEAPAMAKGADVYALSYQVADRPFMPLQNVPADQLSRFAVKGDARQFLATVPSDGSLALRLAPQAGPPVEAIFTLTGLEFALNKLGGACGLPVSANSR